MVAFGLKLLLMTDELEIEEDCYRHAKSVFHVEKLQRYHRANFKLCNYLKEYKKS